MAGEWDHGKEVIPPAVGNWGIDSETVPTFFCLRLILPALSLPRSLLVAEVGPLLPVGPAAAPVAPTGMSTCWRLRCRKVRSTLCECESVCECECVCVCMCVCVSACVCV